MALLACYNYMHYMYFFHELWYNFFLTWLFIDINECTEGIVVVGGPSIDSGISGWCEQLCENKLGGYECVCHRGYTLNSDNKTCTGSCSYVTNVFSMNRELSCIITCTTCTCLCKFFYCL